MDDLRDEHIDESENADALLDDSIFEEVDLDLIADEDDLLSKPLTDDADEEEEEEEEEILDELDALAAEEEEEDFDFYGDEEEY
jgi:hypothetical protein